MLSPDTVIAELLRAYPETERVFAAHGMPCSGCMIGNQETISSGARMYHLDLRGLMRELDAVVLGLEISKPDAVQ